MRRILFAFCLLLPLVVVSQTVGVTHFDTAAVDGYMLLAPMPNETTYLVDNCGRVCHTWTDSLQPGLETVLLADGSLLRASRVVSASFGGAGAGGRIARFDWDGNLLWEYYVADSLQHSHHDIEWMPNGNVLVVAWESHTEADAIANGRNPSTVTGRIWSEKVMELRPIGTDSAEVVWEWRVWDHLVQDFDAGQANFAVVASEPRKVDLNFPPTATATDWLHINGVAYHEGYDQIVLSVHHRSEIWIIDHSTTTAEAAGSTGGRYGHGGELLWRWGNPSAYDRGTIADKKLFSQHDARWIPDSLPEGGGIMVFNNGFNRPGDDYSTIEIIAPPMDSAGWYTDPGTSPFGPAAPFWNYTAPVPTDFYSINISGATRLADGSTFICAGDNGEIFEINAAKELVWRYVNPVSAFGIVSQGTTPTANQVFRSYKILPDDPALAGRTLTPGDRIELMPDPLPAACISTHTTAPQVAGVRVSRNAFGEVRLHLDGPATDALLLDAAGRQLRSLWLQPGDNLLPFEGLAGGLYFLHLPDLHTTLKLQQP
jgi:hypothetical protein